MHNLSFHIGVKLLRPKILSFTDGCWPFRHSKTVARWGRERRRRRGKRGGGEGSPQPGEGKAAGKEERWRETMLESPALRKIQASNSVYTRQPRRTPFMILRNQATGVSNAFPRFFPFFFFHRHAKYTPDFETLCCCCVVRRSMIQCLKESSWKL